MRYVSTRGRATEASSAEAIVRGLAPDGGLYTPARLAALPPDFLPDLAALPYAARAARVMALFLTDFTEAELLGFARQAYDSGRFDTPEVAPVRSFDDGVHLLELWHGPTCAFKDMALQMLPHLLRAALPKTGDTRRVLILTATSGDTGKAALEGFRDLPGIQILVFYPKDGVSRVQELQMVTQEGEGVCVSAVRGNFDDAQTGVKALFSDAALRAALDEKGCFFSSANSINLGRLVPQAAYYFSAYCDLVRRGAVAMGAPVHICVPTGNFGNILSALMAREMGLPVARLLCASNRNNVLTDFIRDGRYDRRRVFYNTLSPSMDILVSSNLERALYLLSEGDTALVRDCMDRLGREGAYELPKALRARFAARFYAGYCDDAGTREEIRAAYEDRGYLIDPHTAVALRVAGDFRAETGDGTPVLVASTASPFKFCGAVLSALGRAQADGPEKAQMEALAALSGVSPPPALTDLWTKPVRFTGVTDAAEMERVVRSFLA
ncbi:MAG: threonine synthase [Oscillospiraceae bacterium]|jgi:threonine synthase|nr:threonine synthase [Oscillospiraceae bacterium]